MMGRLLKGVLLTLLISGTAACEGPEAKLKGQENATITFYGQVVDQDGKPLQGVRVTYLSEAFASDWSFEKRGEPLLEQTIVAESGDDGRFEFTANTHILFRLDVAGPPGYRHLYDMENGGVRGKVIPNTHDYLVTSWGRVMYKSDPERPAVYVFVKDGVREVSALPSRGGYYAYGKDWRPNEPAWPRKPSLSDVVQKVPATQTAATSD